MNYWHLALVPIGLWALNAAVDRLICWVRRWPDTAVKRALLFGDDGRSRGDGQHAEGGAALKAQQRIPRLPGPES